MIRSTPKAMRCCWWMLTAAMLAGTAACGRADTDPAHRPPDRLVSLSPAITQMLLDLKQGDRVVGVGRHDPVRPEEAVVVGDLYQIDYERLLALDPTDIFIQPSRDEVPARLRDLARQHGWRVHSYQIETLADVFDTLIGDPARPTLISVADAVGTPLAAQTLVMAMQEDLANVGEHTLGVTIPDVLMLIGTDPPTAAGRETFLDEILTFAAGRNVLDHDATGYPVLDRERIVTLAPEVIVIVRGERGESGPVDDLPRVLRGLDVPAVANGRVVRLSDEAALLPSTRAADVARRLAAVLHPDHVEAAGPSDPDATTAPSP